MNIYICGTGNISASTPFGTLSPEEGNEEESRFKRCVEPLYKEYIDPKISRRMSRVLKIALASAKMALKDAVVEMPDAVIVGTAIGCLEDTEKFLNSIIADNEEMLSPTSFIQSTHNSISSLIAITLGCHGYNSTYVNRGFSFESALLDAELLLENQMADTVLVGGTDELTAGLSQILTNDAIVNSLPVPPSVSFGEGASYFILSHTKTSNTYGRIVSIKTFFDAAVSDELFSSMRTVIDQNGGVDLVLYGGNSSDESDYIAKLAGGSGVITFKKYCGEFFTSTAYALWLSALILRNGLGECVLDAGASTDVKKILIFNRFAEKYCSFVLLQNE